MTADSKFVWVDGKLVPYDQATTHLLSHTLHYGSGVFEGIRAYKTPDGKTAIFRAKEHVKRLFESASVFGMKIPFSETDLTNAMIETIRSNQLSECYIRPIAYINDRFRGLKLPASTDANVAIAVWPWGQYLGDESHKVGIRIMISTYRRADVSSSLPWAKITGGYLTSVLARREASANGYDEALMLDQSGMVAEGSGENIFMVKDGILTTPPKGSILPGLTRDAVIQIAKQKGLTVVEEHLTRNELMLADELFFTGTAVEVTPIREVGHTVIGTGAPGPVTKMLSSEYFKCVRGQLSEFKHWLTYV